MSSSKPNNSNSNSSNNNNNDDQDSPAKKKLKVDSSSSSPSPSKATKQTTLHPFFAKPAATAAAAKKPETATVGDNGSSKAQGKENNAAASVASVAAAAKSTQSSAKAAATTTNNNNSDDAGVPDPIIPQQVAPDTKARWKVGVQDCMIIRTVPNDPPRQKVAALDVDGTLLVWRIAGWPSKLEHYELWSADIIGKLQDLYDKQNYKLLLISNQGAIRGAFTGKKATFVKNLMEWLAKTINRPVHAIMSTNKKLGYHKPEPGMWKIAEVHCNQGQLFNVEESFFVGDSTGDDDSQGGVDSKFAANVSKLRGGTLKFFTPEDYFGPCDSDKRKRQGAMADYDAPPSKALAARTAFLGGYLTGPVVLLLSGVQGSGKSTFCNQLFIQQDQFGDVSDASSDSDAENNNNHHSTAAWVHLSQDTINKGKPGKREAVEEKARQAIQQGQSVVVDRMHLDPEQRSHFIAIAQEMNVPAHIVVFQAPKEVIVKRLLARTNHPGGVQGEKGVKLAMTSLSKMVLPNYKEESLDLITCVHNEESVKQLSIMYRQVQHETKKLSSTAVVAISRSRTLSCGTAMPTIALGTMKMGKRMASEAVSSALKAGIKAIDTAPTYKNEEEVGQGLASSCVKDDDDAFLIVKVPKRATQPEQVRQELNDSLSKLKQKKADLLLLHWPCDVIETGTLKSVWQAMEQCVADGKCRALGVCNFNVDSLRQLLPHCSIPPAVNQVERHPLLPQVELLDFCANQNIVVQAHTPLGQGSLLSHETVAKVAEKAKLTPAQVLLKWNLQQGVAVVPKCSTEEHQKQVLGVLGSKTPALSPKQMKMLNEIETKTRFVAPPFMATPGNVYTWKD